MQSVGASEAFAARTTIEAEARPMGFPLIAAGALAGLVGVAAVVFSQSTGGMQRYAYREVAGAALALALMLFLAGSATSLPLARAPRVAGIVGVIASTFGIAGFVLVYPYLWNTSRDYSIAPVVLYALGLSLLSAANASGLISAYVQQREARVGAPREDGVTDEEVMRDILDTTSRQRLTWGGMRADDREILLTFDTASAAVISSASFDRLGLRSNVDEHGLETDVDALLAFRGVKGRATEEYDNDNVNALARLRAEKAAADANRPWWARLWAWFKRR